MAERLEDLDGREAQAPPRRPPRSGCPARGAAPSGSLNRPSGPSRRRWRPPPGRCRRHRPGGADGGTSTWLPKPPDWRTRWRHPARTCCPPRPGTPRTRRSRPRGRRCAGRRPPPPCPRRRDPGDHRAEDLVAQGERRVQAHGRDRHLLGPAHVEEAFPEVHVRMAHAAVGDLDQHLGALGLGRRLLDLLQRLGGFDHGPCAHDVFSRIMRLCVDLRRDADGSRRGAGGQPGLPRIASSHVGQGAVQGFAHAELVVGRLGQLDRARRRAAHRADGGVDAGSAGCGRRSGWSGRGRPMTPPASGPRRPARSRRRGARR